MRTQTTAVAFQNKKHNSLHMICATLAALLLGASGIIQATAAEPADRAYKIAPQPVSTALKAFAAQSDMQLIFTEADVGLAETTGLTGTRSPRDALAQILKGTGLEFEFTTNNVIVVRKIGSRAASTSNTSSLLPAMGEGAGTADEGNPSPGTGEGAESSRRMRLAQKDGSQDPTSKNGSEEVSSETSDSRLEEIVVTAQKRKESLKDVPISISVMRGADLDKSTAQGMTELLNRVPGVATTVGLQGGQTQVAVRGVTSAYPLFNGSSPIAYYLDSVPFGLTASGFAPDMNPYDMDHLEVLRGPQGTLYGASALNGVIRVLTHDADLDAFELKARTSVSTTDGGGQSYRGDMAINLPIIEGKLAARAVVGGQHLDGWIDSPLASDVNETDSRNYRLKVSAKPSENLSIGLSAWRSESDVAAPSTADDSGRITTFIHPFPTATDFDTYGLKVDYDFSAFSISSTSGYLDYLTDGAIDVGTPAAGFPFDTHLDARVFSEEIVATSKPGSAWRWSTGAFYRDSKDQVRQDIITTYLSWTSKSKALFGELGRRFLDQRMEWTLGMRYFEDDVGTQELPGNAGSAGQPLLNEKETFHSTTPRAVLTWHATNDLTLYGSYSEGFRSGFPQNALVLRIAPGFPPVEPDKLTNYEVGAKGVLPNQHLSFDAAVYYIDWKDTQQQLGLVTEVNGQPVLVFAPINTGAASGTGIDLAVTANPMDGLELGLNLDWNDLESEGNIVSGSDILFRKGQRLGSSPEYTLGAFADYGFPLGSRGITGRISASANKTARLSTATTAGTLYGDPMLFVKTGFSIESPRHWIATLYVDNINNEDGIILKQLGEVPEWRARVRPRTVGLQVEYQF